jgi:predicted Zn-dependent protease
VNYWTEEDVYLVAERAHALYEQGCYADACTIFEGLLAIDPENAYCREALGAVYLAQGEPARSLAELDRLLASYPGHADARARRCEVLCRLGRFEDAQRELEYLAGAGAAAHARRLRLMLDAASGVPMLEKGTQH